MDFKQDATLITRVDFEQANVEDSNRYDQLEESIFACSRLNRDVKIELGNLTAGLDFLKRTAIQQQDDLVTLFLPSMESTLKSLSRGVSWQAEENQKLSRQLSQEVKEQELFNSILRDCEMRVKKLEEYIGIEEKEEGHKEDDLK